MWETMAKWWERNKSAEGGKELQRSSLGVTRRWVSAADLDYDVKSGIYVQVKTKNVGYTRVGCSCSFCCFLLQWCLELTNADIYWVPSLYQTDVLFVPGSHLRVYFWLWGRANFPPSLLPSLPSFLPSSFPPSPSPFCCCYFPVCHSWAHRSVCIILCGMLLWSIISQWSSTSSFPGRLF